MGTINYKSYYPKLIKPHGTYSKWTQQLRRQWLFDKCKTIRRYTKLINIIL